MSKNNSKIIWKKSDGRKKLFTVIPKSENQANQYRDWNPFYSKLAAALFNGLEIFPFKSDSKIFYSGSSSTTTLNHLLDIIDSKGIIYLQKNNSTKIKNLKNVVIVDQEKNSTLSSNDLKEPFDVIYLDIITNENLQTQILNHEKTLKNSGFLIIILNSISKISDSSFRNQINNIITNYSSSLQFIQEINLSGFFKNCMMVILQKTE
jgi:fibrillarin-like pre-rRNA processing protein